MSITVTPNGRTVEAEDEKGAKRAMAKLVREEKAAQKRHHEEYAVALLRAQAMGFSVLDRKARGETMPDAWRYYHPGHEWAHHLYRTKSDDMSRPWKTEIMHERRQVLIDHYGYVFVGGVCNGGGYCHLFFLKDAHGRGEPACYAVGVEGDTYALVEIHGVTIGEFSTSKED